MQTTKLKYDTWQIVFQEVPNEVTLAFNITGCPRRCVGCHSAYLQDYFGNDLSEDIDEIVNRNKCLNITCVCFMGGDQNLTELNYFLGKVRKKYKLKTCLYTGSDDIYPLIDTIPNLDYLKIGRYDSKYGGLDSPNTNQKFYKNDSGNMIDITYLFQKNGVE